MKRIISFLLIAVMLFSALPMAYAYVPSVDEYGWPGMCMDCASSSPCAICNKCPVCTGAECNCQAPVDYATGTQVVFDAEADNDGDGQPDNAESYTITVPAKLAPGAEGTVTLSGAWASNRVVTVTAESSVTLVNNIASLDQKILDVLFDGISETGSNTEAQTFTEKISVADIEAALFGTWSGKFNYNVDATDYIDLNPDDGSSPVDGDVYKAGDYTYTYRTWCSGWHVTLNTEVTDQYQTTYGPICESINGEPVTSLNDTFNGCVNLTKSPIIPDSVTEMGGAFFGCTSLVNAPVIPDSVTSMGWTFRECSNLKNVPNLPKNVTNIESIFFRCSSLEKAPAIPDSVTNMSGVFAYCTSLTDAPVIPSTITHIGGAFSECTSLTGSITVNTSIIFANGECFKGVDFQAQNLSLVGPSTQLDMLGSTGINYCVDCNGVCLGSH